MGGINITGNNKLARNTLYLYVRMLLIMGVTLFTSRVILSVLGVQDFGLYNVVCGVVALFMSVSSSLGSASDRFITYSLGLHDYKEQNRIFCTSVIFHIIVSLVVLILCETVGLYMFYYQLVIPADRMVNAFVAYQFSIVSLLFMFVSLPYISEIIAHEDMSAYASISILDVILRLSVVYLLKLFEIDKLSLYAFLLLFVQFSLLLIYIVYCKHSYKNVCKLEWIWDKSMQKKLMSFSGWIFCGTLSSSLCIQGTVVLVNMFFGPVVNAALAIATQVQTAVIRFGQSFQTAIKPQIIKSYAELNLERTNYLVGVGTRFSFYLMMLIIVPIVFKSDYILRLWLEVVPDGTSTFVLYMVILSIVNLTTFPVLFAIQATADIKNVQILELIKIISIPTSYIIFLYYPIEYIPIVVQILMEMCVSIGRLIIYKNKMGTNVKSIIIDMLLPIVLVTSLFVSVVGVISENIPCESLFDLIEFIVLCLISIILIIYSIGITKLERQLTKQYIFHILCRK